MSIWIPTTNCYKPHTQIYDHIPFNDSIAFKKFHKHFLLELCIEYRIHLNHQSSSFHHYWEFPLQKDQYLADPIGCRGLKEEESKWLLWFSLKIIWILFFLKFEQFYAFIEKISIKNSKTLDSINLNKGHIDMEQLWNINSLKVNQSQLIWRQVVCFVFLQKAFGFCPIQVQAVPLHTIEGVKMNMLSNFLHYLQIFHHYTF